MPLLKLGSTVDQVNIDTIKHVLVLSLGRVKVDVSQTNLTEIFRKSNHFNLLEHSGKPENLSKNDLKFFQELIQLREYTLLKFLLTKNENLLHITTEINGE